MLDIARQQLRWQCTSHVQDILFQLLRATLRVGDQGNGRGGIPIFTTGFEPLARTQLAVSHGQEDLG